MMSSSGVCTENFEILLAIQKLQQILQILQENNLALSLKIFAQSKFIYRKSYNNMAYDSMYLSNKLRFLFSQEGDLLEHEIMEYQSRRK